MAEGRSNLKTLCLDHSAPSRLQCSSKVKGKGLITYPSSLFMGLWLRVIQSLDGFTVNHRNSAKEKFEAALKNHLKQPKPE